MKIVNSFYPLTTLAKISIFDVWLGSKCTSALKHLQKCHDVFERLYEHGKVIRISLSEAGTRKKRLWHKCFPVNFVKFLRTCFLKNTSGRLPLSLWIIFFLKLRKSLWVNDADEPSKNWNYPYMKECTTKQVHIFCLVYISVW